jgi:hypothetical protein
MQRRIHSVCETLVVRQDPGSFGSPDQAFDAGDPSVGVLAFEDVTRDYVINRGVEIAGITAATK